MEDNKKGTRHRSKSQEALRKVADPLLYDVVGDSDGFALVCIVLVCYLASDTKSGSVEGRLWDESVRKRDPEKTTNKGRKT